MAEFPATGIFDDVTMTSQELIDALEALLAAALQAPGASALTTLDIASDVLTPTTAGAYKVNTQASAAADDLKNIAIADIRDGGFLFLIPDSTSRVVTIKHNAGGSGAIDLRDSEEHIMDQAARGILLQRRGSKWYEVYRQGGRQINIGDTGGFSGMKFNPTTTRLEFYIDGGLVGHIGTDGAYTDDV